MTTDDGTPVGAVEIAARLGVRRHTVDKWRVKPVGFPAPDWTVGGRPAWRWGTVRVWAETTGRLPGVSSDYHQGTDR